MSINRWMDKEAVVYIHNGILLSHKKECIWVSSNEVDEPRTYYTEWRDSERKIPYSNTYIWNLEKWSWRIYLQGNNGETDIENRLKDMGKGEERVRCMESNMETYTIICKIDSLQEFVVWLRKLKQGLCINLADWDGEGDGREVQKGGDICKQKKELSVQFSCLVVSGSLRPHGLQHTRLPCPSPTPGACSNSYPLSWWCYPTTSSSVVPFSSCLQPVLAPGSFQMSQFFASSGQSIGVSASASVLSMNIFRTDFL